MSTPMNMTNCPSDETLAAFIDGRLEARQRVVEHVSSCADCYAVVSAAWDFQAEEESTAAPVIRGRFGSRTLWTTLATAAVASFVFLYAPLRERIFRPSPIEGLIQASRDLEYRPIEGRLSGGFSYKERYRAKRGPGDESPSPGQLKLQAAAGEVRIAAERKPSPEALAAVGTSNLLLHEITAAVDAYSKALLAETSAKTLKDAIDQSKNTDLLNDLAVAYSERAIAAADDEDSLRALKTIARAVQLSKRNKVITWNRALILERAGDRQRAFAAWQDYLDLDPTSAWAQEARTHQENLRNAARVYDLPAVKSAILAALSRNDVGRAKALVQERIEQLRVDCEEEGLPDTQRTNRYLLPSSAA